MIFSYQPDCVEPGWRQALGDELKQDYIQTLYAFLSQRLNEGVTIYPSSAQCFNAFNLTPFEKVKVVILGQDPYHGPRQAHGLCFSVPHNTALPPSLKNIFRELEEDVGVKPVAHGCLESWAERGVFLLNTVLTVEESKAGSHQGKGWEQFTDHVIRILNESRDHLVFMLWGSHAQKKAAMLDRDRHLVLEAVHPSPLSAYRGFLGCKHFSKANAFLTQHGRKPVDWQL